MPSRCWAIWSIAAAAGASPIPAMARVFLLVCLRLFCATRPRRIWVWSCRQKGDSGPGWCFCRKSRANAKSASLLWKRLSPNRGKSASAGARCHRRRRRPMSVRRRARRSRALCSCSSARRTGLRGTILSASFMSSANAPAINCGSMRASPSGCCFTFVACRAR